MPKKPIEHYEHPDTLPNNPTQELSGFAEDEEYAPTRYPRDTALDPQLVWKGKDQQNDSDLEVQTVPIYTQEHIQPQAIIENLRAQKRRESDQTEMLFEGFNDLDFSQKIEFYQHEQNWHNRFILGDSLAVMNSLAEKEHLKGQVQMIYLDPPYGIKFSSNWQVSTRKREVSDTKVEDVTPQPEQVKAFRDTWELGIHSYLTYLRDRLTVAYELLANSGSIFVQISDENVHRVRCLLDEVFGSENFVGEIVFKTRSTSTSKHLSILNDFILWYAKDREQLKFYPLFMKKELSSRFSTAELPNSKTVPAFSNGNPIVDLPEGTNFFSSSSLASTSGSGIATLPFIFRNQEYNPATGRGWRCSSDGLSRLAKSDRIISTDATIRYKFYFSDFPYMELGNLWTDQLSAQDKSYIVQTNATVLQRCMLMTTDPGDLVLDPTCGSGTTAYVAEQWGRRWITVDTSRVALALARTRLMAAQYPYYQLEDANDIKQGFAYQTAPHVTLSDIANNTEIDDIHTEYAKKLDPLRAAMNHLIGQNWEEWEVPIEINPKSDAEFQKLHRQWLSLKRERQQEMDASTARRVKNEILYDWPYEDRKRVRVTGPFTMESLSPHLVLDPSDTEDTAPKTTSSKTSQDYHQHILEHLKTAGVQTRLKDQRITFDWLESLPGEWLHAEGVHTGENGETQSVAISIGPEYDTVGRQWIKEAAKAAIRRIPKFDMLIVVGFAFEGYTADESTRMGPLTILPVKMSPELLVRELKNTGDGNLFMVFGEPDIEIVEHEDDTVSVKLLGVDVYDPKKGLARSNTPDDIACWFIDTAYTGEAFFVRHAYFTGADEPYKQLQRALNSEIDAEAWEALYRTESLPFPKPETGKIAVKVINHYGDEVMKEYKV
ncbi:site-specific DNA-methyltransferase [Candidatus Poribacteria bacterium]|nr:site-specific DNA-methyltransferase [Candidatus Poribacteria bacterium]MYA54761.1 site-specific DNA-methyltransferase [Candidatus Poribacteria bacterium]